MSSGQALCAGACDSSRGVGQIIAAGGILSDRSKRTRAWRKPNEPEHDDKPNEPKFRQKPNEPEKFLIFSGLAFPMQEQLAHSPGIRPGRSAPRARHPQPSGC
jgi:hypothetical protein